MLSPYLYLTLAPTVHVLAGKRPLSQHLSPNIIPPHPLPESYGRECTRPPAVRQRARLLATQRPTPMQAKRFMQSLQHSGKENGDLDMCGTHSRWETFTWLEVDESHLAFPQMHLQALQGSDRRSLCWVGAKAASFTLIEERLMRRAHARMARLCVDVLHLLLRTCRL
jgi:hypothetical protein